MASIRKKALHGSNKNQIKSPPIKRSPSSSVILQGWLFKQGSDGLMLWKKRWFVLADYCLFYYKGPAEEKLLGSCLLASYKISPCTSEDKIYRKFSFKAEHANMRTYYFSAESQASMIQWINALSLASICQENRNDNLDSGKIESWVVSEHQPVYVNTPPKPKQILETSDLPSNRICPENLSGDNPTYLQFSDRSNVIQHNVPGGMTAYPQRPYSQIPHRNNCLPVNYEQNSFIYAVPPYQNKPSDLQKNLAREMHNFCTPLPPNVVNYHEDKVNIVLHERYIAQPKKIPPRPHSADFLEYDFKGCGQVYYQNEVTKNYDIRKLQRPKSSLDVIRYNDHSYDSLHWSEEAYAEKMRQTSHYVTPHCRNNDKNNAPVTNLSKDQVSHQSKDKRCYPQDPNEARYDYSYNDGTKFNRSASARFPLQSRGENYNDEESSKTKKCLSDKDNNKGNSTEEREESMQRLLVWKQRMLQSPLTRKTSSGSARQLLIPSKIENNTYQKKFSNKDENNVEGTNFTAGSSDNQNIENYSEKIPFRKKNCKENPKFQYHSLSSDEDDIARICDRDGRKHNHKSSHNKRSALKTHSNLMSSNSVESSDNASSRSNRNSNGKCIMGIGAVAGPSRKEPLVIGQSSIFDGPIHNNMDLLSFSNDSNETNSTITIPPITGHNAKSSIDSACNGESQSPTSSKPLDSGYSTLQGGILLKNSHCNELHLTQCSTNYSFESTNETEVQNTNKEWGLKLDESRVIKEFSYHYINAKNDDPKRSLWLADEGKNATNFTEPLDNNFQPRENENDFVESNLFIETPINVISVKDNLKNETLNIKNLDTFSKSVQENSILSDIHNNTEFEDSYTKQESIETTSEQNIDAYYSNSNSSNTVLNKKLGNVSASEFPRDAMFPDHNAINTLSSDEDRDDEVATVLGKHQKIAYDTQDQKNNSQKGTETDNSESEALNSNSNLMPLSSTECLDEKTKEEHYMPMTPKKKLISSPDNESASVSRNASVSSFYAPENSEHLLEESSYVEMSHNSTSSSNNGIRAFKPSGEGSVTPGSSELQLFEDNPDYEYISKDLSEPVYVELSSSFRERKNNPLKSSFSKELHLNKNGKDHLYYPSLKHSLPDILNTSSPQCSHNSTKSDSSDADDEASKDLDCITTPTHPRFSLSDTFRPASYYLGANHSASAFIGLNLEQQDSSDSDLVSPPPIPVSTPPVDELGLSLDLVKTCTLSPKDEKGFLGEPSCNYWKALPGCECDHKSKKLSNRYLPSRPLEDLSSETDSIDSFRKEQLLKRRPVSADILDNLSESNFLSSSPSSRRKSVGSDIESVGFSNPEDRCVNYDNLTEDMHVNDQFLESLIKNNPDNISNMLGINPSLDKQSSIDSRFKINNVIWEYEKKKNDVDSDITDSIYKKYSKHKVKSTNSQSSSSGVSQSQSISMHSQSGAPYYYSDILKSGGSSQLGVTFDMTNSSQSTSSPPLNNNKLRKMKNSTANSSDSSDKDNHFRPCSTKNVSERKKVVESTSRQNKNINSSSLITKDHKLTSTKLLSRSLTPDFHSKKHSSSLHENKQSKNVAAHGDTADYLLRRARSFDGLLDDFEPSEEKPRVLRASPSDAIFKLLQTTQNQGKNSEYTDKLLFPNDSFKRSEQDHKGAIQAIGSNQVNYRGSETLRLARSLDNLKWQSESPILRKPFINSIDNFNTTPLLKNINDLNNVDMGDPSNSSDASYRNDDGKICDSISKSSSEGGHVLSKDSKRGALERVNSDVNIESIQGSHLLSFENKHGLSQSDSLSSSPCDMIMRSNESKQLQNSHLPPTFAGAFTVSGSACGVISPRNGASNITTSSGDNWNLELSAGELLGRTHEELVLLLIQLRRRSSGLCKTIDEFQKEISSKIKSMEEDPSKSVESLNKNEELKKQLLDLEKQYEKGKPLVNLVDNMVKLGSLYHKNTNVSLSTSMPQRREFNQKVQEQRLLAEEKKEWERLPPDQKQLQEKVKQLYKLDQILKKESSTLQNLQQDKAVLEQALIGLRQKLDTMHGNPVETEQCRHQQRMLEKGLTRVRSVLAQNSKKLEETIAENARLEQELVILKQKLQFSRKSVEPGSTTVALELELKRVQDLVGDLQRQRQYLCLQVRQLTEKSNSLSQQIEPLTFEAPGTFNVNSKRRPSSSWVETDLDSQVTQDVGIENLFNQQNTTASPFVLCDSNKKSCIIHKEKPQEIKTVRIVKRESERRQRDRERNGTLGIPLINIISRRETIVEESSGSSSSSEMTSCLNIPDNFGLPPEDTWSVPHTSSNPPPLTPRTDSVNAVKNFVNKHKQFKEDILLSNAPSYDSCQVESYQSTEELAPVYLSKAAQEIVQEVAWRKKGEKRLIPKEKRRYHTVSGQSLFQEFLSFSSVGSRDDLDMERALRNRVHTPDVVRSTLSRDAKFTAETIDTILGTPSKIVIPERYKPETEPQVSKEELLQRSRKAEAIRKMLTQSSTITPETTDANRDFSFNSAQYKYKVAEEKQQREHLLQLNQILAQQVTEKSKIVAGAHLSVSPS